MDLKVRIQKRDCYGKTRANRPSIPAVIFEGSARPRMGALPTTPQNPVRYTRRQSAHERHPTPAKQQGLGRCQCSQKGQTECRTSHRGRGGREHPPRDIRGSKDEPRRNPLVPQGRESRSSRAGTSPLPRVGQEDDGAARQRHPSHPQWSSPTHEPVQPIVPDR